MQIGANFQEPSMIVMEMRLRRLEEQVDRDLGSFT